ncbi:MAG: TPM domain-containing protein [Isosphaeraceae bacterium]
MMMSTSRRTRGILPHRPANPFTLAGLSGRIGLIAAALALAFGVELIGPRPEAQARQQASIRRFDGSHFYLGPGVPDRYQAVRDRLAALEQTARPGYYIVVLRSSGAPSSTATRDYANVLFDTWRAQASADRRPFDADHSLLVVVALDNHQVAVHTGEALRALGLKGATIEREVIEDSHFADLARAEKYPEAIVALLDAADRWIARHDATTRRPVARTSVPAPAGGDSESAETGRSVAVGLGIAVAVVIAAVVGLLWFVHRRTRGHLDQRIKEVRSKAADVMDRLDGLKERIKLLPTSSADYQKTPMAGETARLYEDIQARGGRLWDRWLQVMDAVDRAEKLAAGVTSPFRRKALHDAETTLEQKGVFEEIQEGAKSIAADLDRLDGAHEAARAEASACRAALDRLRDRIDAIAKFGLPDRPFQAELHALAEDEARQEAQLLADPLGARSALEADRRHAEQALAKLDRLTGLFADAQKLATTLEATRRQAAEHRARGLRLDEDGGNPDPPLARADEARAAVLATLQAGDADAAGRELESASSLADEAKAAIDRVREARDYSRRETPERARVTERLRAAMPHAEADYHRLEAEFAPSTWAEVARGMDQVRSLIGSFDRLTAEASDAASESSQRYLAAASALRGLAQQQKTALRLMSAISDRLNALTSIRDECRKRRDELEAVSRQVEDVFRRNDPQVGTMALDLLGEARRNRDAVLAASERPRPDWPSVREGIVRAMESFSVAQDQAEVDVRGHQQLSDEYDRARGELERVADLLSSRREDRPAANRRFRSAAEVLDQIAQELAAPHGEWTRWLDQVRGAQADLLQAEQLARQDILLASQAQSEVDAAANLVHQVQSSGSMGIAPDTSAAESALDRAGGFLRSQQYEAAIDAAGEAQQAARRAYEEASHQAAWQQMQVDAERRRWQGPLEPEDGGSALGHALATAGAVAAGVILNNVLNAAVHAGDTGHDSHSDGGDSSPASEPAPAETDTGTGGGSWQDETGQGAW